jgi:hypothetical protein
MEKQTQMEYLAQVYPESIVLADDDFDDAIIGVSTNGNVIYSVDKMIDILVERYNMTHEGAYEYFDYNIDRAIPYMTDGVPPVLMNSIPI